MIDPAARRRLGQDTWRDVMRTEPPPEITPYKRHGILDFVFAEMWSRPVLTRKDRRWITLACVCAVGQAFPIRSHMRAAFVAGDVSYAEMQEFVLHFAVYCGWPASSIVETTMLELAEELGLENDHPDAHLAGG